MKLYDNEQQVIVTTNLPKEESNEVDTFDSDIKSLDEHIIAYESLTNVYGEVSVESFCFVDKNNYTLFNEYMRVITRNLDVKSIPVVSLEAIELLPTAALNHHLALEGFIGSMWDKVKKLFVKIYEAIKAFFSRHFTRIGRLKKKLENLKEVLNETPKDLKQVNLDTVPSSLTSKFPYSGTISETTVERTIETAKLLVEILEVANKEGTELANRDILSKDFVAKVKSLKEKMGTIQGKIVDNESKKSGKFFRSEEEKKNDAAIKNDNKNLQEMSKQTRAELKEEEGKLSDVVGDKGNAGAEFDDKDFELAKKEMSQFVKKLEEGFKRIVNKPITGGKTLKGVKVTTEDGIELEFDTDKDTPSDVTLGGKAGLSKMVDGVLSILTDMEKITTNYSKVNDTVMKNLDTVDKLVGDLDKVTGANEAAYKKILQNKVKERLKLMQTFFKEYNRVNRELMKHVADTGDGVVAYTVVSLKYFG